MKNLTSLFILISAPKFMIDGRVTLVNVEDLADMSNETERPENTIVVGVLLPKDVQDDSDAVSEDSKLNSVLPAVVLAAREQTEYNWEILVGDTGCSSTQGPLYAVEMFYRRKPDVFLGPVCKYVLAPVVRFSSFWNVPVFTTGGMESTFRNKESEYSSLTCLAGEYNQFSIYFRSLMEQFNWHHITFIYHENPARSGKGGSTCGFTVSPAYRDLGGMRNENISHIPFDQNSRNRSVYEDMLKKSSQQSRIIAICASNDVVREIMLAAQDLGMLESGEYVFINVDLFSHSLQRPWFKPNAEHEENEIARSAFLNVLTISSSKSVNGNFNNFKGKVENVAAEIFNTSGSGNSVNSFVGNYYDAVKIFSSALTQLLSKQNRSEINGKMITNNIWSKTHQGVFGSLNIDENGDRKIEFSLLDLKPDKLDFEVVQIYYGANNSFQEVGEISWPNRKNPPPDVPECGFQGELCETKIFVILLCLSLALLVLLMIGSCLIFKHYKEEADIASMTWKIDQEEIKDVKHGNLDRPDYNKQTRRGSATSVMSTGTIFGDMRQKYMTTATYKGSVVATKNILSKNISMNRKLLIELKRMKDLQHDHLVRFVGACLDHSQPFLVTEYCPRGSLQDILEEDMNLDWNFKFSLINDIVKGLSFIHASEIAFHGNLKSSNCVVDSRFVLKLTDFGLHELRGNNRGGTIQDLSDYDFCKTRMWTAPELLLCDNKIVLGTPKGDIFAFSIIVHEIAERNGPWGTNINQLEPQDIVKMIRSVYVDMQQQRPEIDKTQVPEELVSLLEKCWSEDPKERPDIREIRGTVKKINKDNKSGNIMDNLLTRMEQYANNLESLVEDRTRNYLEEKSKCEDLLHELLPKSVATDLINKKSVSAQSFEAVTIYFSDIVGFTNLSSASAPCEIFEMLNDLYTVFDSIIQDYDVYKVETIGDAYMVVSGLPEPNGDIHAQQIARMSLKILEGVCRFEIRHRPGEKLKVRIGLHTGPCVAGVVGIKMPRYCLFGDTVNTASRMESNGEALKIHMSGSTAALLETFQTFHIQERGELEVKGKGKMRTYWLQGETQEKLEDTDSGLEMDVVTKPKHHNKEKMVMLRHKDNKKESLSNGVTVPALARQEFLRLKRSESRKARSISRPNSMQIEDERIPFTRFNSKETSICE